jgi:hypothetical protein
VPFSTRCVLVLPEDNINDDDPSETQVYEEAHDSDDEEEDDKDSTSPEGEDNQGRDDILSKITEDDQKEILEYNWMLLKLLFEQQAEWNEERTRMLTKHNRSRTIDRPENPGNQFKIFKMVDPLRYRSRANVLGKFHKTLRSNFASHKHLFPGGDTDQVKYAVCFLDTWNHHPDMTE